MCGEANKTRRGHIFGSPNGTVESKLVFSVEPPYQQKNVWQRKEAEYEASEQIIENFVKFDCWFTFYLSWWWHGLFHPVTCIAVGSLFIFSLPFFCSLHSHSVFLWLNSVVFFLFVSLFFVLSSICWCVVYLISAVTMIACSEWDEPDVSDYSHTHKHMSRTQTWDGMAWQIEVRWTHDARHTHHTYNMTQEHAATSACQMDIRMILIT